MAARQARWLVAAAGIVAASGAVVACSRPSAPPASADANADTNGDAGAGADGDANAGADASASAAADVDATASADAGARGGPHGDGGGEGGAAPARVVRIDEGSEGKTIELAPGQTLVATLTANPTTGFDWAVIKAPAALGAPAMGFVSGGPSRGDQLGASGKRRLTWTVKTALPAGDQPVELGYARSFEKGVAPFKTFAFKVRAAH